MVHKLMEPIRIEEEFRMKGSGVRRRKERASNRERDLSTDKKLQHSALQGKLRSLSPEVIMRVLQKEK